MTNYEQQAKDFLQLTGVTVSCTFKKNDYYFSDDNDKRDIYSVIIQRGMRRFTITFGNSVVNSTKIKDVRTGRLYSMNGRGINNNMKIVADIDKLLKEDSFGYQVVKGTPPTEYDILACLTKYDPVSFSDFCSEFWYDEDSRKAEKIFEAVREEWLGVMSIWSDSELELLREIN